MIVARSGTRRLIGCYEHDLSQDAPVDHTAAYRFNGRVGESLLSWLQRIHYMHLQEHPSPYRSMGFKPPYSPRDLCLQPKDGARQHLDSEPRRACTKEPYLDLDAAAPKPDAPDARQLNPKNIRTRRTRWWTVQLPVAFRLAGDDEVRIRLRNRAELAIGVEGFHFAGLGSA